MGLRWPKNFIVASVVGHRAPAHAGLRAHLTRERP